MIELADVMGRIEASACDDALRAAARLRLLAEQVEAEQIARARGSGWSWQQIAECLGVTKQTVHRKYRHLGEG